MKVTYSDGRCLVCVEITPLSTDSIPTGPVQLPLPPWYFPYPPGLDPNTFSAFTSQNFPPPPPPPPPAAPPVGGEGGGHQPPPAAPGGDEPMPDPSPPNAQPIAPGPQVDPNWTAADQVWEQYFPEVDVNGLLDQLRSSTQLEAIQEEHHIQDDGSTIRPPSPTRPVAETARTRPHLPLVPPLAEPRRQWEEVLANERVIEGQSKLQVCVANSHDNDEARPVPAALEDQPIDGTRPAGLRRRSHVAKRTSQYAEDKVLQAPTVDRPEYHPRESPPSSPLTRASAGVASMVANPDPDLTALSQGHEHDPSTVDRDPVKQLEVAQAVRRIRPRGPRCPSDLSDTTDFPNPSPRIRRLGRDIANALIPRKKKKESKKRHQSSAHIAENFIVQDSRPGGPQRRSLDVVKIGQEARLARQSLVQQRHRHQLLESAQPATWPNYKYQSSAAWPVTVPMAMSAAHDRYSQYSIVPRRVSPPTHLAANPISGQANVSRRSPPQTMQHERPDSDRPAQTFPVRPVTPDPNCPWGVCSACLPRDSSLL